MIDRGYLKENLEAYGFACSDQLTDQLDRYAAMLVEWNEKMNLTAITEPNEIVIKHFLDSLLLLKAVTVPKGAAIIDVGTGAGFPSVPVALYQPDVKLCLLDSLNKRVTFLTELTRALGVKAACVHGRAEEVGGKAAYRECYDIASARAVAHLRELSEYCLPFTKVGGAFVALKGYEIEQELEEARFAVEQLGGQVEKVEKFEMPGENKRAIVVIRKVRQTPAKYPRASAKMKKSPLQKRG